MDECASLYSTMKKKLTSASKIIPEWKTFHKDAYSDGFSKKFTDDIEPWHPGDLEQIVAMAHLDTNKPLPITEGGT